MIEPDLIDALDNLPQALHPRKQVGTGDLTRRYVHAAQEAVRKWARREKREESDGEQGLHYGAPGMDPTLTKGLPWWTVMRWPAVVDCARQ